MKIAISPTGPKLSQLTFGVWRLLDKGLISLNEIREKVDACLDVGITTFDHADIYGDYQCESAFGKFLKEFPQYKNKIEIVTKCGIALISKNRPDHRIKHYNYTTDHIRFSVENSLRQLGVDVLDLVLFHRPSPLMNPDEICAIAEKLTLEGKVKFWGASNFTTSQWSMVNSRLPMHTNQIEVNPLRLDPFLDGTLDFCMEKKISPMFWSPLAGGRLMKPATEKELRTMNSLQKLSQKYEVNVDVLTYSWLLRHPVKPIVVLGTNDVERIINSVNALKIEWDLQDWFHIWEASNGVEVP